MKKQKDRGTEGETPHPNPDNVCAHGGRRTEKIEQKKIEAQRAKPRTPIPATDALIGDEGQTGKRNKELVSTPNTLDPSVASYDPQGSYGEPIL